MSTAQRRPQLSKTEQKRAAQLDDIRDAINDLIRQVRTAAMITRDKGKGADGVTRSGPKIVLHRTKELGLLVQLKASVRPSGSAGWDADGALSISTGRGPESRPPVNVAAMDLLADVTAGSHAWRERLGGKGRRPLVGELRALTGLAHTASTHDVKQLHDDVQSWVRSARVALSYDVPAVDLQGFVCNQCGGGLRVLADASSDVWCAGGVVLEGPLLPGRRGPLRTEGCGATWPRGQWVLLLEQQLDPVEGCTS